MPAQLAATAIVMLSDYPMLCDDCGAIAAPIEHCCAKCGAAGGLMLANLLNQETGAEAQRR